MTTVSISGYGTFHIDSEKIQELLNWLSRNSGVRTQNNEQITVPAQFKGLDLINENC